MKLSTIRRWKRDALEFAYEAKSPQPPLIPTSEMIRLYHRLAEVCSLLERRIIDENFAEKVKDRNREGTD